MPTCRGCETKNYCVIVYFYTPCTSTQLVHAFVACPARHSMQCPSCIGHSDEACTANEQFTQCENNDVRFPPLWYVAFAHWMIEFNTFIYARYVTQWTLTLYKIMIYIIWVLIDPLINLWPAQSYGSVYQQQFVKLTACIRLSASSKHIWFMF